MRNHNLRFEFMTQGQQVMFQAFGHCVRNNRMIFLLDNGGSGFSYTLAKAFQQTFFNNVRVITVDVIPQLDMQKVVVKMYKQSCTVKFSNLNKRALDPHELLVKIHNRLKQDLLGKKIMIVFDHVHLLRSMERVEAFVNLLLSIPFPCGIILRTKKAHLKTIMRAPDLFATIRAKFDIKKIPAVSRGDIISLCHANGLMDKILIEELAAKSKGNLKLTQYFIDQERKLPPSSQLALFE